MGDCDSGYQFGSGIGDDEVARLELQGGALAPATRMILTEAGIRPGMRVLDLGCGAGDVTFVAADLVGPGGSVVSVDRSPQALARARLRAEQTRPGAGAVRGGQPRRAGSRTSSGSVWIAAEGRSFAPQSRKRTVTI